MVNSPKAPTLSRCFAFISTSCHGGANARPGADRGSAPEFRLQAHQRRAETLRSAYARAQGGTKNEFGDKCGTKNHRRREIEKVTAMVFTDTTRVQPDLVGVFDLLDQLSQRLGRIHCAAV